MAQLMEAETGCQESYRTSKCAFDNLEQLSDTQVSVFCENVVDHILVVMCLCFFMLYSNVMAQQMYSIWKQWLCVEAISQLVPD